MDTSELETQITLGLVVFLVALSGGMAWLWRSARTLRNALAGQDGHRLMTIFANIFLIDTFLLLSTAVRALMSLSPDLEIVRQIFAVFAFGAFAFVHAWALISVRGIIKSGDLPPRD